MSLVVDTCVIVDVLRSRTESQRRTAEVFGRLLPEHGPVAVSVITVSELRAGLRASEEKIVENLLACMRRLPVDEEVARLAGDYLRSYAASHGVELGDALVAATARAGGMSLWTHDRKHFPMGDVVLWEPRPAD